MLISVALIISIATIQAFDPSMFEEDVDEEFNQEQSNNQEVETTQFDPSMFEEDEESVSNSQTDNNEQTTTFDPSMFEEDTGEEFNSQTNDPTPPTNNNQNDNNLNENNIIENVEENSFNLVFLAGFGIVVVALLGITILYSLHYFRRKKVEL